MLFSTSKWKYEKRKYLTGILFCFNNGRVEALSSDGHRLSKWLITTSYKCENCSFIIHNEAIEQALISEDYEIGLTTDGTLHTRISRINGLIDDTYSDVDEKILSKTDLTVSGSTNPYLNCKYLDDLHEIAKLLRSNKSGQYWAVNRPLDNNSPIIYVVEGVDDFIHIIMPMKEDFDHRIKALETIKKVTNIEI